MKVAKADPIDELFMHRCLELAANGLGHVAPNPMVGAVVVYKGKVIGEGFHKQYGQAHAEVNAINSVDDPSLLKKSTLYVNLEPCVHTGQTPPCTDLILGKKIPAIIVGTADPNKLVEGKGIRRLINNGCNVKTGILNEECHKLNKRFFTFHERKRPYVILKWAQTQDGYIDIIRRPGESIGVNWISNPLSRNIVHKWRSIEQGVMVGTNTVVMDNPDLNVRYWHSPNPIRIILDRSLRIPKNYNIWDNTQKTLIFNAEMNGLQGLTELIKVDFTGRDIYQVFDQLYKRNIVSVMVEGGKELHENLINNDIWDEARVFIGDKSFKTGIKAPEIFCLPAYQESILNDRLVIYKNQRTE